MKKYIKVFVTSMLLTGAASCSGFLDKEPLDQLASSTFWKNQAEVDMALAGVYARVLSSTFNHNTMFWDVMGGDLCTNQGNAVIPLAQGMVEPNSGSLVSSIYSECYQGISACNFFLDNVDRSPITDDVKNKYKGEVLFLRAMFYFTLTEFYGAVPMYTKLVSINEAKVAKTAKADVVAQILTDLETAIAQLPNVPYNGHAVKGSALALKAKVLLHNERWEEAAAAANQVITDGVFSIFNNYRTMFLATGQNNNPEIMMSARYLNPDRSSQGPDIQFAWHGTINPRAELVDDYECTDGLPISTSPRYNPANWRENRDPRLLLTIKGFEDKVRNSAGVEMGFNYNAPSGTGYMPVKGLNWDALPVDYNTRSEQDWVLLRYAEVLLIYAEAKNEHTGPDASVYSAINTVRSRPGVSMPDIPAGLSKEQMRQRIRHERRVEFALEGKRYLDIKRWKTAETYIPTLVDPGGVRRQFNAAKHYVFPFPQSEIDTNDKLEQNPNY
ncbi:RagB/SusD family nutrient uptake outer membrane protein [Chitinophaga sp.]|uniref:RagB/SusD family nutrient uptake outer membrane protein n=1 Tax=Chitinophaga sp. TaxID=1869181 RepID=UPI0031DECE78